MAGQDDGGVRARDPDRVPLASRLARGERVLDRRDTDDELGWGLSPDQWQVFGGSVPFSQRAVLLWRIGGSIPDAPLRARRAFDSIFPTGTPVSARATERGIEIVVPLDAVLVNLRHLAGPGILPDAVIVDPGAHVILLRVLRREIRSLRGVQLLVDRGAAAGGAYPGAP